MPIKTKMLDFGGFVHLPEEAMSAALAEYLCRIDVLLVAWRDAIDRCNESPFAAELLERRKHAEREFDDFAAAYRDKYAIKHVQRDPLFLPVSRFFARCYPIRQPFAILHCSLDLPLHTVHAFENDDDLANVNAALGKVTPLRWWQDGPLNHPCYLFGEWVWELKPTELHASDKGLTLLFEKAMEKDQLQRDRLTHNLSDGNRPLDQDHIPEVVRVSVWRRDGGKCARCGSHEGLDFAFVGSASCGDGSAMKNIQLLCVRCREKI